MDYQDQELTLEEIQAQNQKKAKKRVMILFIISLVVIAARFMLSDPPKYVKAQHNESNIRYLPGVLDRMSDTARAKLTSEQIAKFKAADEKFLLAKLTQTQEKSMGSYAPQEAASEIQEDIEAYKEEVYQYERRKQKMEDLEKEFEVENLRVKPMLVLFKHGGFMRAYKTNQENKMLQIMIERGIFIRVTPRTVKSVIEGAPDWQEPIPKGFVKLEPAKGIKITLNKNTAKNISIKKKNYEI